MNLAEILTQLDRNLHARGFKYKIVPSRYLENLRARILEDVTTRRIDDSVHELYKDNLDLLDGVPPEPSVIIVAAPQPISEIVFVVKGKEFRAPVPPTYHHDTDALVAEALETALAPGGRHIRPVSVPLKLLAVHSGLAKYGRNNITYVDGMGSYFRLTAFATDFPAPSDCWQDLQAAEVCMHCTTCVRKCPTGAIDSDQFRVHAERCLTYFTESPGDFPAWLDDSFHHCLVGCMRCQTCCPLNKDARLQTREVVKFSEEETSRLLRAGLDGLPSLNIEPLLQRTGLSEDLQELLPRNLRKLIDGQNKETAAS